MPRGVILGTCDLLSEVLDDRFVYPVIHGHFLGHLGCPDLDFIDFRCVLGPFWKLLLGRFGRKTAIVDVQIDVGIRKFRSKSF